MTDTIDVCPECDQSSIEINSTLDEALKHYRCKCCGATFDQPNERERQSAGNSVNGLAKKLLDK